MNTSSHSFDGKGREVSSELRMRRMSRADAGEYQCVVSNKFGATYSDRADVAVYVFPKFLVTPRDVTAQAGATAALRCAARGLPAPKVSWSKDSGDGGFPAATERRIAVSRVKESAADPSASINSFVIHSVKAEDMGSYRCTASNPAGSISWNITLTVLEVPRFLKPMGDLRVRPGQTAVLECLSSGSPRPRLQWSKDGRALVPTERHFFAADGQLLIIVKAGEEDAGRLVMGAGAARCRFVRSKAKKMNRSQRVLFDEGRCQKKKEVLFDLGKQKIRLFLEQIVRGILHDVWELICLI